MAPSVILRVADLNRESIAVVRGVIATGGDVALWR